MFYNDHAWKIGVIPAPETHSGTFLSARDHFDFFIFYWSVQRYKLYKQKNWSTVAEIFFEEVIENQWFIFVEELGCFVFD